MTSFLRLAPTTQAPKHHITPGSDIVNINWRIWQQQLEGNPDLENSL